MTTELDPASPGAGVPAGDAVLTVEDLNVSSGDVQLVKDVSFSLAAGERVGLIGESGSGKSLSVTSLMGLLGEGLRATGSIRLAGVSHDLVGASQKQLAKVRGRQMTMVFQEPMTALNPTMRVVDQVAEVMLVHKTADSRAAANKAAIGLLERVHLPDPERAAKAYPHQLSGGQRQRVVLAIALANDPKVLLCDEPTTALDVTVQAQMLELIAAGVAERQAALLFITHDLAVVATICERVLVMYGGRIVEAGPVEEVFRNPRHRYTEGLLAASDLEASSADGRLNTIPGTVPPAGRFPSGCVFRNRCAHADEQCAEVPGWWGAAAHGHACWHPGGTDER
jgi:oligopeptide/dipeptide ABC transporter ATP-binding protein